MFFFSSKTNLSIIITKITMLTYHKNATVVQIKIQGEFQVPCKVSRNPLLNHAFRPNELRLVHRFFLWDCNGNFLVYKTFLSSALLEMI